MKMMMFLKQKRIVLAAATILAGLCGAAPVDFVAWPSDYVLPLMTTNLWVEANGRVDLTATFDSLDTQVVFAQGSGSADERNTFELLVVNGKFRVKYGATGYQWSREPVRKGVRYALSCGVEQGKLRLTVNGEDAFAPVAAGAFAPGAEGLTFFHRKLGGQWGNCLIGGAMRLHEAKILGADGGVKAAFRPEVDEAGRGGLKDTVTGRTLLPAGGWFALPGGTRKPVARSRPAWPLNIFNLDSTHYTHEYGDDKMNAQGLREYVHRVLGKGAFTHFFICPGAQTTLVDTKTLSPSWWRMGDPDVPLNDHMRRNYMMFTNGVDTIQVEIDAIRAHGVSPWLSMRMNDNHNADEPKCWLHSKFWVEHPEYRKQGGFNYSVPAVQEKHLAFVEEMLERYDVDGFECDWMRWPIPQEPAVLTAFMRRVRAAVDAAAKRRGHPILLGVRVASRPGQARRNGTDAILWAQEKLVDWIVPANFFGSVDFDLPQDEWLWLVDGVGSSAWVIPCLDTGVMTRDPQTGRTSPRRMLTLAEYCGWAKRMYDRGAPGVYYFNLFTYFEEPYHVTDTTPWDFIVAHGLTPESIRGRPASIPANWWYEP